MGFLKNLNKKLFEDNKNKKLIWIVLAGCIGILMISVSELTANDNFEYTEIKDQYAFLAEEQTLMLETKLEEKISEISGAGKTSVMITADSSKEYFYAENHSENSEETEKSIEREFVVIEGENGDEPIVLKIKESKIRGVLVICEGGDNPVIKEKIIEAVCALLDVSSNSVSVAKMA